MLDLSKLIPKKTKPVSKLENMDTDKNKNLKKAKQFTKGLVSVQDIIAPEAIEVDFTYQKINDTYTRSFFIAGYPPSVPVSWLSPIINFNHQINISMFIYPMDISDVMHNLKRKITEMEAELISDIKSNKLTNIETEIKLNDAKILREELAKGSEKFFQFGLYITILSKTKKDLDKTTKQLESTLRSLLIIPKKTTLQMEEGFKTTIPMGVDKLMITRNMDTTSVATTFPFVSSELTMDDGIMYGINEYNDSLVVFDRFKTENANMLILAKSGAGKSYTVKLEILRQLMFDTEVLVLDPEHEYEELSKKVNGQYIDFSFNSNIHINPFDLANLQVQSEDSNEENELNQKLLSLHGLFNLMLGEMSETQKALLDKALVETYRQKGITIDPQTQNREPPLMEDLYKTLKGMETEEALDLAVRFEKYILGSFRGIFDQPSNINITNQFTVFSTQKIEDELRPIVMYIILDFIWTRVKNNLKKRILVIDEAWYFMQHTDSAQFIYSMAKRARKYYLGITTITQDVEDFLENPYGKPIVSNSSIQFLMKQSTASLEKLTKVFKLSKGEQQMLMSAEVGEGIFFAGKNHVALRVVSSPQEHSVITTNPEELIARK